MVESVKFSRIQSFYHHISFHNHLGTKVGDGNLHILIFRFRHFSRVNLQFLNELRIHRLCSEQ